MEILSRGTHACWCAACCPRASASCTRASISDVEVGFWERRREIRMYMIAWYAMEPRTTPASTRRISLIVRHLISIDNPTQISDFKSQIAILKQSLVEYSSQFREETRMRRDF